MHLSAPAVKRRVDRLERDGVVRGYTAIVDPAAFGWHTEAFVDLYCEGRMPAEAIKRAVEERARRGVRAHGRRRGERPAARDGRRHASDLELALERIRAAEGIDPHRHRGRALDPVQR